MGYKDPMAYPVQADPTNVFGRRVLAALIDGLLLFIPLLMLFTSQLEYTDVDDLPISADDFCDARMDERGGLCVNLEDVDDRVYFTEDSLTPISFLGWGVSAALYVVLQGLTGWTIGKLITGIRTVREDGRPPGLLKAFVRWLLLIVDGFPYFLPLVGFIMGLSTVGHRRLGDMAAGTFVVRASAAGSPIAVPGLNTAAPAQAGPWGSPPPPGAPGSGAWGQPAPGQWAPPPVANPPTWTTPSPPSGPSPASTPTTADLGAPQWDEARGTYIQWDPTEGAWMQWSESLKAWSRMPGQ